MNNTPPLREYFVGKASPSGIVSLSKYLNDLWLVYSYIWSNYGYYEIGDDMISEDIPSSTSLKALIFDCFLIYHNLINLFLSFCGTILPYL